MRSIAILHPGGAGAAIGAGLRAGFHLAAADVYRRLEEFGDAAEPPPVDEVKAALLHRP